jgi:hypothetical protein
MYDKKEKRFQALHHPYTTPKEEDIAKLDTEPAAVYSRAYDLVLNGTKTPLFFAQLFAAEISPILLSVEAVSAN